MKFVHFDPAVLLVCAFRTNDEDKLKATQRLLGHLGRLVNVSQYIRLLVAEEHWQKLSGAISTRFFVMDRVARSVIRPVIIRYMMNYARMHRYGDVEEEWKAVSRWREASVVAEDDAVILSWMNLLGSPLLEEKTRLAPLFSDLALDPLIDGDILHVESVDGEQERRFAVYRDLVKCIATTGVVDPVVAARLRVEDEPEFVWENTGHGATPEQRRIIERVARESAIVRRAATTYQNPQGGGRSLVSATAEINVFQFAVTDRPNLIRGRFYTLARSGEEARVALRILENTLESVSRDGPA